MCSSLFGDGVFSDAQLCLADELLQKADVRAAMARSKPRKMVRPLAVNVEQNGAHYIGTKQMMLSVSKIRDPGIRRAIA